MKSKGLDLKRSYQKYMLIAFIISGLVFASAFALAANWNKNNEPPAMIVDAKVRLDTLIVIPPVNRDPIDIENIQTGPPPQPPEIGQIVAVDDTLVPEVAQIPTQLQLLNWVPETPVIDLGQYASPANVEKIIQELLPQPDEFIPYDEGPVAVRQPRPIYPPLAMKAGMEAVVWVKILIDKEGTVRDIMVIKSSENEAGFEEAATEAACNSIWKPAIANGQPVAVWVSFAVKFKLH
jgi:protein TonB